MSQSAFIADHLDFWFHSEGGGNKCGYSNSTLDLLFDEWKNTLDPEEQKKLVYEIQNVIADDMAFFCIQQGMIVRAYNAGICELVNSPWGMESEMKETYWV